MKLKYEQHGHVIKVLRCDSGKIEMSKEFREQCQAMGISVREAADENQQQNPVER